MALPVGQSLILPRRGDGTLWTPDRSVALYSLAGHSIPFIGQFVWPAQPAALSTVNVANDAQLQAAIASGNRIVVAGGSYSSNVTINNHQDIQVEAADDAFFTGQITIGSQVFSNCARIGWRGGNWRNRCMIERCTDITIDNVNSIVDAGGLGDYFNEWSGKHNSDGRLQRVAVLNSTFAVVNASGTGGWCVTMFDGDVQYSDVIFANVRMNSVAQTCRFHGQNRFIYVDCVNNDLLAGGNGFRMHYGSDDIYMADSVIAGSMQMNNSTGDYSVRNATFSRVTRFHDQSAFASLTGNGLPNSGTVNDCDVHNSSGTLIGQEAGLGNFTGSNNIIQSWDGVSVPDYSSVGADH